MRAYPKALRLQSSNLDPAVFWRKGVQMVALNWQKWDEGMMLNEGMFSGTHGWVLKPSGYRSVDAAPPPKHSESGGIATADASIAIQPSQADAIQHKTLHLRIEVFAAQDIPLPLGDSSAKGFRPYLKCEVHVEKPEERSGAPIEGGGRSKDGEYKKHTKSRKGIEPDYAGEVLEFVGIPGVVEELSFVRSVVADPFVCFPVGTHNCILCDRGLRMATYGKHKSGHLSRSCVHFPAAIRRAAMTCARHGPKPLS